jgi:hypothetical protein
MMTTNSPKGRQGVYTTDKPPSFPTPKENSLSPGKTELAVMREKGRIAM